MAIDITGLLTGVLSPEQKATAKMNEGLALAQLEPGRAALAYAPGRAAQATGGLSRLLGVDARPPQERVAEALTSLDLNQPEDQAKAIQLLQQNGLQDEALRLSQAIQANNEQTAATRQTQQNREQQQRAAMTAIAQSNLPDPAKEALRGLVRTDAIADYDALYERLGFDASAPETTELERNAARIMEENPDITYEEALSRANMAATAQRQTPRAPSYSYQERKDGSLQVFADGQLINTFPAATVEESLNPGEFASLLTQLQELDEVTNTIQEAINVSGTTSTGLGSLTSGVPLTPARRLRNLITTVQSNLAFDKIDEMKRAAQQAGASGTGLGQISNIEIELLKSAVAALDQGMSEEELDNKLREVLTHYNNARNSLLGIPPDIDWSSPAYAGVTQVQDGVRYIKVGNDWYSVE